MVGVADAGHHIFALGVQQVIAVHFLLAGRRVAGEGHAGAGVPAHVAEDHGHDVDGRAQVMRDVGGVAVIDGALAIPGFEDGFGGQAQLLVGILGEIEALVLLDDRLEIARSDCLPDPRRSGRCRLCTPFLCFVLCQDILKGFVRHAQHDRAEHLDQAAVGVVDKALVAGQLDHACGGLVVQTDVEHGIHHAGHGELGAGAAGNQQRIGWIAEFLAGLSFDLLQGCQFLVPHAGGEFFAVGQVGIAGFGGDGEAGGTGTPMRVISARLAPLPPNRAAHAIPVAAHIFFSLVQLR